MQTIYLDISNKGVIPTIYAKQGDVGRKFEVVLTDSGLPYIPAGGSAFSIWYEGDSGQGNYTDIGDKSAFTVNGNKVTVELITQMLAVAGEGSLCLVLNGADGSQIASWSINYAVESIPGVDSEEAKNYYTAFSNAVQNLPYPDSSLSVAGKAADSAAVGVALARKAPAGYGLGVGELLPDGTDLNTIRKNGWYYWHSAVNAHDSQFNCMRVWTMDGGACMQESVAFGNEVYWGTMVRRMIYNSNDITPWEWVNPPMLLGVEYRTTERYNGKPVYTMLFDCGALPNATSKEIAHGISNCIPISYYGSISNQVAINSYPRIDVTFAYTKVIVESKTDQSAFNLHIALKYTKN